MLRTVATLILSGMFLLGAERFGGAAEQALPDLPKADWRVEQALRPTADAAKAWRPMTGSPAAELAVAESAKAYRLPCKFEGMTGDRASWDLPVKLNLRQCQSMRFHFLARDIKSVSHFSLYLHSGQGWYAASFAPLANGGWETIEIRKNEMKIEGAPAGWDQIDTIRVSAWRGGKTNTEFWLADLGLFGEGAKILILQADSVGAKNSEIESVREFCRKAAQQFAELGLDSEICGDLHLTAGRLEGLPLVVMPHNPRLDEKAEGLLLDYLARDGRLICCYRLPAKVGEAVGVAPGKWHKDDPPGRFSEMRLVGDAAHDEMLPGAPKSVRQHSWNINAHQAVPGRSRVVAWWRDAKGQNTGLPAVVLSANGAAFSHVLLNDDPPGRQQLLLALLAHLTPALAKSAAAGMVDDARSVPPFADYAEFKRALQTGGQLAPEVAAALSRIGASRARASELCKNNKLAEGIALAQRARRDLVELYCAAQQPAAKEFRGFWCHSAFGVGGMTWDTAIRNLADNGFTAILPNMLWGGVAYYPSEVLPVAPEVAERGDQIAACLAACKKYGVECHVWKVNWNMSGRAPAAFAKKMHAAGRTQASFDGKVEPRWLCPSHPANQQLEIDAMVEVATKYDVAGIHFDYIRYPGAQHCFCAGCRARFEKRIGRKVARWPADTRDDAALREQWLEFRRGNITAVVRGVSEVVRKKKPKVKISAAVFRDWPRDRETVGQDWKVWGDEGWLDFACPMDYEKENSAFEQMVRRQLEQLGGKTPCYPGIGRSVWTHADDVVRLSEQIKITRRLKTGGFTIFNYGPDEAENVVPLLGKGLTRRTKEK